MAQLTLNTEIQFLKGVGPKLGALLNKRGIYDVRDFLNYYPRAYEDRRAARNIASLKPDDVVSLKAQIFKVTPIQMGRSHRKIYDITLRDASGLIHAKFFRVPYKGYFERFALQSEVRVIGKVLNYRGKIEFHHPEIRELSAEDELQDDLVPIYPEIEGLSSTKIHKLILACFDLLSPEAWGYEKFPDQLLKNYDLVSKKEALIKIHKPPIEEAKFYIEQKSRSHRRLIFEEFFWLELYLAARKSGLKQEQGIVLSGDFPRIQRLRQALPFVLTTAQDRALNEVLQDLRSPYPMNRLVQGDVGSGKTMVAFMTALAAVDCGHQACLMVPTEILAEQHYKNAAKFLEPLGLKLALLTGKTKTAERRELLVRLEMGDVDLLIGTHALIEDAVQFKSLALVIIDEQHRFGVEQRAKLKKKGLSPHFLVMTATPIPRTLAMTVYGDLEVSIIDELPPGRSPIQTRVAFSSKRKAALDFMVEQIKKGRQAYIIYPLVEESEKMDLKNAVEEFEKLNTAFPEVNFGLLHGRMKPAEKEEVMSDFRERKFDVLVSTTVIEVGVDVPNANIMVIEHAERFGLSQLHQLRGRVGRGEHKSFCILLLGHAVSDEARERTRIMEESTDGFRIAEKDLEMRGPGEFLGTRQSGLPGFQLANLVRDVDLLTLARKAAFDIFDSDARLSLKENRALKEELFRTHGPTELAGIA